MGKCVICGTQCLSALKLTFDKERTLEICQNCNIEKNGLISGLNSGNHDKIKKNAKIISKKIAAGREKGTISEENEQKLKETYNEILKPYIKFHPTFQTEIDEELQKDAELNRLKIQKKQQELLQNETYQKNLREAISNMKLTTGYNFEGYKITEYHNIISSSVVVGTGMLSEFAASVSDFFGVSSTAFESKMNAVKEESQKKLKIRAHVECKANAIIGVDFDYMTIGNNMIAVSANGTAVTIEKL